MMDHVGQPSTLESRFLDSLRGQLAFHRMWQRLAMVGYVACTTGILVCSTAATLAAGMNHNEIAAYCAGLSTVLVGLEKSLLFREKWKLHLAVATRLSVLGARAESAQVPQDKAVEEFSVILNSYSESLPVAPRD